MVLTLALVALFLNCGVLTEMVTVAVGCSCILIKN